MTIKTDNYTVSEQLLVDILDKSHEQYEPNDFATLLKEVVSGESGIAGVYKIFTYKNSLRFGILFDGNPDSCCKNYIITKINDYLKKYNSKTVLLWYSQRNGFDGTFINTLAIKDEPYKFFEMTFDREKINACFTLNGLEKKLFSEEILDDCIDLLENSYTPFLDSPGTYINDKERYRQLFLNKAHGRTEVFTKDNNLIGMYSHNGGSLECICVDTRYQGEGYGKIILLSALNAIYNDTEREPRLTVACKNIKAVNLYKSAGFESVLESVRVFLRN